MAQSRHKRSKSTLTRVGLPRRFGSEQDVFRKLVDSVFIVMAFEPRDLRNLLSTVPKGTRLSETHVKTIIYNALLGLNHLH